MGGLRPFERARRPTKDLLQEDPTQREMIENHTGSPIAVVVAMRILRFGGNAELWLSQFCYKAGLTDRDRNYHELWNLVVAINALGCIDQFNLGASVGIEILFCRLSAIAEALKNGADRPT